jgi:hypothetical protein
VDLSNLPKRRIAGALLVFLAACAGEAAILLADLAADIDTSPSHGPSSTTIRPSVSPNRFTSPPPEPTPVASWSMPGTPTTPPTAS